MTPAGTPPCGPGPTATRPGPPPTSGWRRPAGTDALATFLHAAGRTVRVVNPTRIQYAGVMRGRRNKTDQADPRLIAAYTRDEVPPAWSPPAREVRELQALVRRRDDLRALAAQEKARLDGPVLTPAARKSVARVVKLLGRPTPCRRRPMH
jgi:transposase